jgi:glycosyltransferase involved in cell wall biosynthesis
MLPKEKAKKCLLVMHTHVVDDNGTDLPAVAKEICPDYRILFSANKLDTNQMNMMYNIADVTMNLASNEGFGLGTCESLMSGTPIIVNVTGGLQDQCGFELNGKWLSEDDYDGINTLHDDRKWKDNPDLSCGDWAKPVWPSNRALVGSPPTPYIFDDRCRFDDAAEKIKEWYDTPHETREEYGQLGREFTLREEVGMSAKNMNSRFIKDMDTCMEKFEPRKRFTLYKV